MCFTAEGNICAGNIEKGGGLGLTSIHNISGEVSGFGLNKSHNISQNDDCGLQSGVAIDYVSSETIVKLHIVIKINNEGDMLSSEDIMSPSKFQPYLHFLGLQLVQ